MRGAQHLQAGVRPRRPQCPPDAFVGFLDKTCALGSAPGCNDLVTLYAEGSHGVGKDLGKAKAIAHRACAADIGALCTIESELGY